MPSAFLSPGAITAKVLDKGADDYAQRMNRHHANGTALRDLRTQATGEGVSIHFESAEVLRATMREWELMQECQEAFYDCVRYRNRALMSAYRHTCYCRVRAVIPRPVSMTLSQVSSCHAGVEIARTSISPPGELHPRTVLATCHASNAPGLNAHAHMETAPT